MDTSLYVAMLIVSVLLMAVVLMQTKESSFSGAFSTDVNSISRTRRGFEKTLFQFTIALAIVWALLAILLSVVV